MTMFRKIGAALLLAMTVAFAGMMPAMAQVVSDAGTVRANVIICVDPDCADTVNIDTMYGATITSYGTDGSVVDSCTVTLTQADFVDCTLVPAPVGGSYGVVPTEMYSGYVLATTQPDIFESEMHGPIYVWYFAPERDNIAPPPTQQPPASAPVTAPVSTLPSTGSGSVVESGLLAGAAFGLGLLGLAATVVRKQERR